jgi:hypothetical protein
MDKQQIVSFIEGQLATGKISREDLLILVNNGVAPISNAVPVFNSNPIDTPHKEESSRNLINTFYGIGAIIVLGGVAILVGQNWIEIGFLGRILVTLGIFLVTYICGFLLNKPSQRVISQVMFTISCALAPLGVYVLLSEVNINFVWPFTFYTALLSCALFGYALWSSKKNILVLITIGFASWAYYSLVLKVFSFDYNSDLLKWAVMLLGFAYILIAHGYQSVSTATDASDEKEKKAIRNALFGLGTLGVLGAGIFIGGIFDLIFIALIFGAFYGSVYLKSRSMLTLGALFLMSHIVKLTSKYFVDSIGWPVALIMVGFLIIGVGYMTYNLNKKYISIK